MADKFRGSFLELTPAPPEMALDIQTGITTEEALGIIFATMLLPQSCGFRLACDANDLLPFIEKAKRHFKPVVKS